jgi:hypothetical protein
MRFAILWVFHNFNALNQKTKAIEFITHHNARIASIVVRDVGITKPEINKDVGIIKIVAEM